MPTRKPNANRQPHSSHAPSSARANRASRAAQSGRIASKSQAKAFARKDPAGQGHPGASLESAPPSAYRAAYTPGANGRVGRIHDGSSREAPSSGQYSRHNAQYSSAERRKKGRGKKIAIGIAAALFVMLIGTGTAFAMYVNSLNNALVGDKTEEEKLAIQDVLVPRTSYSEPFYMMLIGSDARADDEAYGQRSDTNILVRIDPTSGTITMLSIPRDTQVDIEEYGKAKFNAAYNFGANATIREAKQLTGVDISHYAEVNFETLISLIDSVGGVEVEVSELIDDPDAGDVVIQPGLQTLDGEAALVFARSRAYIDGDFRRTSNQRLLIEALIKKIMTTPVPEIPGLVQRAAQSVTTDLNVQDVLSLTLQFRDLQNVTIYSAMVPSSVGMERGVSYVYADKAGLSAMMQRIDAGQNPDPSAG